MTDTRAVAAELAVWEAGLECAFTAHGDPHFHNLIVDDDGEIVALLDLDEAVRAPGELDLMFLHPQGPRFVRAVLTAYPYAADPSEVFRFHLRSAFGHLVFHDLEHARTPSIQQWIESAVHHHEGGQVFPFLR